MRKVRTDRWDNTRGRSEDGECCGTSLRGKRAITFQSLSVLIWRRERGVVHFICGENLL